MDEKQLTHLLYQISENKGYYDTIYFVNPDGLGTAGVAYNGQTARILSPEEASGFDVADRAWFRSAISGRDTFSQPLVSRTSGNRISNVAIPVRQQDEIIEKKSSPNGHRHAVKKTEF